MITLVNSQSSFYFGRFWIGVTLYCVDIAKTGIVFPRIPFPIRFCFKVGQKRSLHEIWKEERQQQLYYMLKDSVGNQALCQLMLLVDLQAHLVWFGAAVARADPSAPARPPLSSHTVCVQVRGRLFCEASFCRSLSAYPL